VEHALGHSAESQRALDSILAGPYAEVAAYQIVQTVCRVNTHVCRHLDPTACR